MNTSNNENIGQKDKVTQPNPTSTNVPQRRKKAKLRLPFDNRKQDFGLWAYSHYRGLITLLVLGIVFLMTMVVAKFEMRPQPPTYEAMYIDTRTLEEVLEEKERLEKEIERKQAQEIEWEKVRNMQSNDALVNEQIIDDRGTDVDELNEMAEKVEADRLANQQAYSEGNAAAAAIANQKSDIKAQQDTKSGQNSYYKGGVTVRFKFENPVRNSVDLKIPAYRCEAGGQVEVTVVLDRNGEVISAKATWGGDDDMRRVAEEAAKRSRFSRNENAPAKHTGTIIYTFVPQ